MSKQKWLYVHGRYDEQNNQSQNDIKMVGRCGQQHISANHIVTINIDRMNGFIIFLIIVFKLYYFL